MKSSGLDQLRTIAAYWRSNVRTGDNRGFAVVVREGAPLVAAAVQVCLDSFAKLSAEEREEGLSSRIHVQLKTISDLGRVHTISDKMAIDGNHACAIRKDQR